MRRFLVIFALFLYCSLSAGEEIAEIIDLELSQNHVLDKQQNYFLTSTDYRIAPKVNPITGEYEEQELDLVVAGSQPVSVRRFYNSSAPYDPRYASWRYNPECFFTANLEWQHQDMFASIGEYDGSVCSFKRSKQSYNLFEFEVSEGFFTLDSDGRTHPLNTKIHYWKLRDPKDKHRDQYMGTITDGSGRVRSFASAMHRWTYRVHWTEKKGNFFAGSEKRWAIYPNTWTPFHIPVVEEKLPNGNIICYTYTRWKKEKQNFPLPQLLGSITAYNADKSQVLGSIQLHYPRIKHDEVAAIHIQGSDGRAAHIYHNGKSPFLLGIAQDSGKPQTTYAYHDRRLTTVAKPNGFLINTEYNGEGKVSAQYAPVGPNGEMCPIGLYAYSSHMT